MAVSRLHCLSIAVYSHCLDADSLEIANNKFINTIATWLRNALVQDKMKFDTLYFAVCISIRERLFVLIQGEWYISFYLLLSIRSRFVWLECYLLLCHCSHRNSLCCLNHLSWMLASLLLWLMSRLTLFLILFSRTDFSLFDAYIVIK